MMYQDNPFASLMGQQFQSPMAGSQGFAGGMGGFGQMLPQMGEGFPQMGQMGAGMFGMDPNKKKKQGGFNPLMLSPLAYAFSKDPKIGLAMLSPGIGIANLLGAFK